MKRFDYALDKPSLIKFFPPHLLSTRKDICKIVVEAIRHATTYPLETDFMRLKCKITIYVDDMTRLFVFDNDKKYYSISLPFSISEPNIAFSYNKNEIDGCMLYALSSIIEQMPDGGDQINLWQILEDTEMYEKDNPGVTEIFLTLLTYEFGYVRYDKDPKGYNEALSKGLPKLHPMHHLDINMTHKSTYKKGFKSDIDHETFIEILDNKRNRWLSSRP